MFRQNEASCYRGMQTPDAEASLVSVCIFLMRIEREWSIQFSDQIMSSSLEIGQIIFIQVVLDDKWNWMGSFASLFTSVRSKFVAKLLANVLRLGLKKGWGLKER